VRLSGAGIERFLARPDPGVGVVLVYGPDAGLVRERADRLARHVVDDLGDPFRVGLLAADGMRQEPGRLLDEARAQSLIGGRRVVRVREAGDIVTEAVGLVLATDGLDALVLLEAGELPPSSGLRQLIERAPGAAALPCYREEGRDLGRQIAALLDGHGLRAEPDALAWLGEHLGADRGVTRSEIDKLALYLDGREDRTVRLEDAALMVGDGSALGLDDAVHAALGGDAAGVEASLERLFRAGQAPARVLRALVRHTLTLYRLAARRESGAGIEQVIAQARPPVHFRARDRVARQLRLWRPATLERALSMLLEAETRARTTGLPDRAICHRAALELCRTAKRAESRRPA
jgi:DNA polymerase III subunit delta